MDPKKFTLFRYLATICSWAMIFFGATMFVLGVLRFDPVLSEAVLTHGGKYSSSPLSQAIGGLIVGILGWLFLKKGKEFFKQRD